MAIDNLTESLILGSLLVVLRPRPVPLRLARRADQRGHHPALAHGGGPGPLLARSHHQHDGPRGIRHRPGRHRRRRHRRRREHRPPAPSGPGEGPTHPRRSRSSSTRRSRSASAIVYACFIEASALLPIFFLDRAHRVVLQAARHGIRPCGARLAAGGAAPAPRRWPHPAVARRLVERPVPVVRVLQRGYERLLTPVVRRPAARVPRRWPRSPCIGIAVVPHARPVAAPGLQGAGLPDALGDQAGHVAAGGDAHHRGRVPRSCRPSPECATSARTSDRPSWATRWSASNFGENWISVDPDADYDETRRRDPVRCRWLPRAFTDVQTYLKERIREVLTGEGEADRRPHLRAGPQDARGEGRRDLQACWARSTASSTSTSSSRRTSPRSRSGRPGQGQEVRHEAGRRAPRRGDHARGRGGRRHLPRRQGLRREGLERAAARANLSDSGTCSSTRPAGGTCAMDDVADVSIAADPEQRATRERAAEGRHRGQRRRPPTSGPSWPRPRRRLAEIDMPLELPLRGARRVPGAPGGPGQPAGL